MLRRKFPPAESAAPNHRISSPLMARRLYVIGRIRTGRSHSEAQMFVISVAAEMAVMHAQRDQENSSSPIRSRALQHRVQEVAAEIAAVHASYRREMLPIPRSTALVVGQPKNRHWSANAQTAGEYWLQDLKSSSQ
jgi:hypothetical protein